MICSLSAADFVYNIQEWYAIVKGIPNSIDMGFAKTYNANVFIV